MALLTKCSQGRKFHENNEVALLSIVACGIIVFSGSNTVSNASAQEGRKPKDEMILGPYAKLGGVKFSHLDHITKNRSVDGTKPIACVECHHTAQPEV